MDTEQKVVALESDVTNLGSSFNSFKRDVDKRFDSIETGISKISEQITSKDKVNWTLIVTVILGCIFLFGFFTSIIVEPLNLKIEHQKEIMELRLNDISKQTKGTP